MNEIITTKELASVLGITDRRVQQLTKGSILPCEKRGRYNLPQSIQKYITYQLSLERKKYKKHNLDINKVRLARENTEARIKEIELQKLEGEIIEIDEIKELADRIIGSSKTKILGIPNSVSRRLLKKTSIREIRAILDSAIYEALDELHRLENI